ncbi:hypothetical protein [Flavobacterium poyangense]|uniref:hypothetical protein n=1 Tax=Flavobacterium poyangense TaxID=2204302 RepID=UPI001420E19C|nr:hypothetical protein [Flavobacterium sp. JXAS1]
MKQLKKIFILIPFFVLSCASSLHNKDNEPINVFLETKKVDKSKKYILQRDKIYSRAVLRIFNGGEGPDHAIDSINDIDYTGGLFAEKYWQKMYKNYINDTVKKYWKKEDFPGYDFILEDGEGIMKYDFSIRYMNSRVDQVISISEPIYYKNKEYIMFYFNMSSFLGSLQPQVVIMKKEKGKWVVVRVIGDYVYY